jgi:hypothetical protein
MVAVNRISIDNNAKHIVKTWWPCFRGMESKITLIPPHYTPTLQRVRVPSSATSYPNTCRGKQSFFGRMRYFQENGREFVVEISLLAASARKIILQSSIKLKSEYFHSPLFQHQAYKLSTLKIIYIMTSPWFLDRAVPNGRL